MVRCRGRISHECLVQLQVVTSRGGGGASKGAGEESLPLLDVSALCEEIGCRMRFLCGLAVAANAAGIQVMGVRHDTAGVYNVVVRLPQASPLAVTALRAACASTALGPVVAGRAEATRQKRERQEGTAMTMPVAVRVLHLKGVAAA
ncbi:hypothetical protein TraAM80_05669 [Trypanosoma rangeli]|uniref:Uncharacterized protein n=1 Tax=Trypanosoma rangeli TaxID=5698 RepID=A0A3R7MJ95_TRYRA|nr:uncharacterized protein TraAM80_05669 [Trypanosoma rangeli]RNF03497.1 hypothetical protein TraAM80_05669 [Trypanosoma rangeli]|eukprot:RNF03497.1 hypothetical protein TraAM80_05669 [Trypanosoma rangeli]